MTSQTAVNLGGNNNRVSEDIPVVEMIVEMPEYKYRSQFRSVLIGYFEQTNLRQGAYVWAEEQTKQYFLKHYNINPAAWDYRNRKGH